MYQTVQRPVESSGGARGEMRMQILKATLQVTQDSETEEGRWRGEKREIYEIGEVRDREKDRRGGKVLVSQYC
ncbi:hypothetical protein AAMO2058_000970500 [Amorphochlora amoebiformis]